MQTLHQSLCLQMDSRPTQYRNKRKWGLKLVQEPRSASKSKTCVLVTSLDGSRSSLIRILNPLEGYLVSAAEHFGILYTLAYVSKVFGVVLISTCLATGKRHRKFSHPHIPRFAKYLVHTDTGVCIIDRNQVVWHCKETVL